MNKDLLFRVILILIGFVILIITLTYTFFLAENLKESERRSSMAYRDAIIYINEYESSDADFTFPNMIIDSFKLPVILEYDNGSLTGNNFGQGKDQDSAFLAETVSSYLKSGKEAVKTKYANFYFIEPSIYKYLRLYPYVQIALIGMFLAFGYYALNTSKKSEQNRVWVGMAKETAHQLGTPISAIMAWIEHLKSNTILDEEQQMVVSELQNDVDRLELVADRFSKIGSKPELKLVPLHKELEYVYKYMKVRAPRKVNFEYNVTSSDLQCPLNAHLFNWVTENLIRNSLDAMDGEGKLSMNAYKEGRYIFVEVSDTGKGIPPGKFKAIFRPGYSTKKRGWGLGLSLSKRIIEEYHGGKIYVKSSKPNELTTFAIRLDTHSKTMASHA